MVFGKTVYKGRSDAQRGYRAATSLARMTCAMARACEHVFTTYDVLPGEVKGQV